MNTKSLINKAIENRQSQEISFRKRCGERVLGEIAKETGIAYSTLLAWRNGKNEANFCKLQKALNVCGLDFEIKKVLK